MPDYTQPALYSLLPEEPIFLKLAAAAAKSLQSCPTLEGIISKIPASASQEEDLNTALLILRSSGALSLSCRA